MASVAQTDTCTHRMFFDVLEHIKRSLGQRIHYLFGACLCVKLIFQEQMRSWVTKGNTTKCSFFLFPGRFQSSTYVLMGVWICNRRATRRSYRVYYHDSIRNPSCRYLTITTTSSTFFSLGILSAHFSVLSSLPLLCCLWSSLAWFFRGDWIDGYRA